ncbi:MAG: phytase [Bryobacterales bacterium]
MIAIPQRTAIIWLAAAVLCCFSACSARRDETVGPVEKAASSGPTIRVKPARATEIAGADADDPAIWLHAEDPARSLLLGINKAAAPAGALLVYDLEGKTLQKIEGLDRPNNVDVEYGLALQGTTTGFAILTERYRQRLRVFAIDAETRRLTDVSSPEGLRVFEGEPGERAAPMGVAVYRRPADGALFAIISRKEGPSGSYLWQYRLDDDGKGRVKATKVREFGAFSGSGEIEAVAVDDELGYVYYADEAIGVRKWHADPDHPDAGRELAVFAQHGFQGDREGIAIYFEPGGSGYILCTDQIPGNSAYHLFRREGSAGDPHDHSERVATIRGGADATDGIEATSTAMGEGFPAGLLVVMNSAGRNFLVYNWRDLVVSLPRGAAHQ